MSEFTVYPDRESLAQAGAACFVELAAEAIAQRGCCLVALASGDVPRAAYVQLVQEPLVSRVAWEHVHVFWTDEHAVPPDHPDSNYRRVREALLDHVAIPAENVHRIKGEVVPDWASSSYETELLTVLGSGGRFDAVFLGLGVDGHTASLYPDTTLLEEENYLVDAVHLGPQLGWRVSMTPPLINAARAVVFLVSGADKAPAVARIRAGESLPAALLRPTDGQLVWMVDRAAAGE
ncbi:MAG: 6-phosphogluconolactonase [Anaerolineae bacterium]|nr:6-phosphogluconolactonase [Anaerolineae bacterium]